MTGGTGQPRTLASESLNRYGVSSILREFVLVLFIAALLFISAGFQLWLNAWIYIIWMLIFSTVFMAFMVRKNPTLLNFRGAPRKTLRESPMRRYDRIFFAFYVPLFILIPIIAGLDIRGFFWFWPIFPLGVPFWLVFLGLVLVVVGETIFGWAMVVNPFFHGYMKILDKRGHEVVSKGPYGWIRHPGYLGQALYYLGIPLLLGSWWAFLLGLLMAVAFVYRTAKEDRALRNELDCYGEYVEQVRKRLVPGIW